MLKCVWLRSNRKFNFIYFHQFQVKTEERLLLVSVLFELVNDFSFKTLAKLLFYCERLNLNKEWLEILILFSSNFITQSGTHIRVPSPTPFSSLDDGWDQLSEAHWSLIGQCWFIAMMEVVDKAELISMDIKPLSFKIQEVEAEFI